MIVNRDRLKKDAKAKLGIPSAPHARGLRNYRPSSMQKRARLMGNAVGALMLAAFAVGALYLLYTLVATGSNIAERKIARMEADEIRAAAPDEKNRADEVQITFKPSPEE